MDTKEQEKVPVWESLSILVLPGPPTMRAGDVASVVVDNRNEIRQFLTSRRARITPAQAGLPAYGGNRRVAGLRREEVALLAGVSVDYYTRLERGNLGGVSEAVLEALARALQLDEAERGHLFDLARAANTTARPRRRPVQRRVRPGVQRLLDAITDAPADLRNGRRDILAANRLGYALYSELFIDPVRPANVARFLFLSPRAQDFFPDWEATANDLVANLRTEAGRNPHDRGLQDLVGGAVHPQPGAPHPLGGPQRPPAPDRPQAAPSSGGW
jgi:transcriptional regulator with XRE-family HTH domain